MRRSDQWAGSLLRFRTHALAAVALLVTLGVAAVGREAPAAPGTAEADVRTGSTAGAAAGGGPVTPDVAVPDGTGAPSGASGAASIDGGAERSAGRVSGSGESAGRAYPPGVTDDVIRIGGSTFTSGPAAVYGEQIAVGFAAGIEYVNDHGGINGRRVEFIQYDDGADPARQLTNVKRLIEVDNVFALSQVYAPGAIGDYVAEHGIPVFHLGQQDAEFTNPWWFPLGGPQRLASFTTSWFAARQLGVRSVAIFYLDAGAVNYSRDYAEDSADDWRAYGVDVPVLAPFAVDQTSCSDALGQARSAGVDFIVFEIDAAKVINCGVEAQLQGYKPPKGWGGYLIGVPVVPEALGDFAVGMYAFDAFGAIYDVPAYPEYIRKISGSTNPYSSTTVSYFVAAMLLRDAVAALGDGITREGVRDVINGFRDWRPGLTADPNQPTWTWTAGCHVALRGGYVIQVQRDGGDVRWKQITPQFATTPVPPGRTPPPAFASCGEAFRYET